MYGTMGNRSAPFKLHSFAIDRSPHIPFHTVPEQATKKMALSKVSASISPFFSWLFTWFGFNEQSLDSLTYFMADETRFNFVTIGHALYILSVNKRQGITSATHYWVTLISSFQCLSTMLPLIFENL